MNIAIQCPYCHRLLYRRIEDILRGYTFYCSCADKGFSVELTMEFKEEPEECEE